MNMELLVNLRRYISIGSHTPGKLKLKIGFGAIRNPKVVEYVKVNGFAPPKGNTLPGLKKTQFNPLTRSMIMTYNKNIIEPKLLHKLFSSKNAGEFTATAAELAESVGVDINTLFN